MKSAAWVLVLVSCLAGCAESDRCLIMPGHPYRGDPDCVRTAPPKTYDQRCDCPWLGYSGFCWPAGRGGGS